MNGTMQDYRNVSILMCIIIGLCDTSGHNVTWLHCINSKPGLRYIIVYSFIPSSILTDVNASLLGKYFPIREMKHYQVPITLYNTHHSY